MKRKSILVCIVSIIYLNSCYSAQNIESVIEPVKTEQIQKTIESNKFGLQLDNLIQREIAYGHFSGVVMIRHKDKIIYGSSSNNLSNGYQTRFDIGSISKQFTAAAILELANNKQLSLSDPINNYLGKYASKKWEKVNIHHLLTHTSGIPSIYQTEQGLTIFFPEENPTSLDFLIEKFKDKKLLFKPEEEFSYSNSGYVLLAAIIENVSKESFSTFIEESVFKKYGLKHTSLKRDTRSANPTFGYRQDLLKPAPIYHSSWLIGAGGIYSTTSDLLKWTRTIQSEDYLTHDLRDVYLKSHTNSGYGYGWQFDIEGRIQHDGGTAGFTSYLSFRPDAEVAVCVLTNRSFEDLRIYGKSAEYVRKLIDKIWKFLEGLEAESLPAIKKTDLEPMSFALDNKALTLKALNDSIYLVNYDGAPITRLIPNTPISEKDAASSNFINLGKALQKRNYWKLAAFGNSEIKFVCYSGLMRYGMNVMRKQTGKISSVIPYKIGENHGLIRLKGERGSLDLIVYFDSEGKMQGIFENGFYKKDKEVTQRGYPIDKRTIYVDGLPYGEESCTITIKTGGAQIKQFEREVIMTSKEPERPLAHKK